MSGLLAALLLRRSGWDLDVFERVESELAGRGAGIVAQPDLIETLRGLGIEPTDLGVEITTRKILDPLGPVGQRMPMPAGPDRLGACLPGAAGRVCRRSATTAAAACAGFAQTGTCVTRAFQRRGHNARSISWWARTAFAPPSASNACRRWRRSMPATWLARTHPGGGISAGDPSRAVQLHDLLPAAGRAVLGYPVAGPDNDLRAGHRRYNVVWYRPADEATELTRLLTDEHGMTHVDLDPAAADPRRGDRRDAGGGRAIAGAAISRRGAADRGADPATDLRPRDAPHGVRQGGDHRRCGVRRATARRGRRRQSGGRCSRVGGARSAGTRSSRRCGASKLRGFRSGGASSSAHGISAPICRPPRPPRNGRGRDATAFPKRCWRRRRCSISCGRDRPGIVAFAHVTDDGSAGNRATVACP